MDDRDHPGSRRSGKRGWRTRCIAVFSVLVGVLLVGMPAPARADSDAEEAAQFRGVRQSRGIGEKSGLVGIFGGFPTGEADGLSGDPGFGAMGSFYFSEHLGVQFGGERWSFEVSETAGNALSNGTLDSTVVLGNVVARFPLSLRVSTYVSGGIAYFSNSFEVASSVRDPLTRLNFSVSEEVDSVVGFNVGGGLDVMVSERFGAFGDVRYLSGSAGTTASITDEISGISATDSGTQDLEAVTLRAGILILF